MSVVAFVSEQWFRGFWAPWEVGFNPAKCSETEAEYSISFLTFPTIMT